MRVRRACAVVQVSGAVVGVRMTHHAAIGHHVHVVMLVLMWRVAVVHVAMVMEVIMFAAMLMGRVVLVRMPVRGPVRMPMFVLVSVLVRVFRVVGMAMTVDRPVRMHVLVLVAVAFDLRFAAAAAAGCAHVCSPESRLRRRRAAPKASDSPLGGQRSK
jgi:hypothetical protein